MKNGQNNLLRNEYEESCPDCTEIQPCDCGLTKPMLGDMIRKVSDLTIAEAKVILVDLMVQAIRECKRQDDEKAEKQYGELWLKRKKELNPLF